VDPGGGAHDSRSCRPVQVYRYCRRRPEGYAWYAHTRSYNFDANQLLILRNINSYFVIEEWRQCLKQLHTYGRGLCGNLWSDAEQYFPGNFWWLSCRAMNRAGMKSPLEYALGEVARRPGEAISDLLAVVWAGRGLAGEVANCWPYFLKEDVYLSYQNYYRNGSCAQDCAVGPRGR
jgi:hypothetical protein